MKRGEYNYRRGVDTVVRPSTSPAQADPSMLANAEGRCFSPLGAGKGHESPGCRCRAPGITSCLGGLPEIVEEGKTGVHLIAGNADDLAGKVLHACDHQSKMALI